MAVHYKSSFYDKNPAHRINYGEHYKNPSSIDPGLLIQLNELPWTTNLR